MRQRLGSKALFSYLLLTKQQIYNKILSMLGKPRVYKRTNDKAYSFYFYEEDGRRVFRKTKETAKSRAQEYADEYVAHYFGDKSEPKIKLREFTKDFFVWDRCSWIKRQHLKGRSFSEKMAYDRQGHIDNHILPAFGNRLLTSLGRLEIEDWLTSLPRSNSTKNQIMYSFRIVLRDAEAAGLVSTNVLDKAERFGDGDQKTRDAFTMDELKTLFPDERTELIRIWGSLKHAAGYVLLASTGIRSGELRALCWRHRVADNALWIEQAMKATGRIGPTKTEDTRIVLLPSHAQSILEDWHASEENPFAKQTDLIFFGADRDKHYSPDYLGKYFHPAIQRAKIKVAGRNLVCHSFRHTFNTIMRQVLPLEILQALTGHKTDAMTNHYDHPRLEDQLSKIQESSRLIESVWS